MQTLDGKETKQPPLREIAHINGVPITLQTNQWEVLDQQKWDKTKVTVSGGGGYVGPNGGYVNAPQVHTRQIAQHEIWLRDSDGKEVPLHLANHNFPVRSGHKILMYGAWVKKKCYLVGIKNMTTGTQMRMLNWQSVLAQAGVLAAPLWYRLSGFARLILLFVLGWVCWIAAAMTCMSVIESYPQLLPAKLQSVQLKQQLNSIEDKALERKLPKSVQRNLEYEANSIRHQLQQALESVNTSLIIFLNGLGGVMFFVCLTRLIGASRTYKKELQKAEQALEHQLMNLVAQTP